MRLDYLTPTLDVLERRCRAAHAWLTSRDTGRAPLEQAAAAHLVRTPSGHIDWRLPSGRPMVSSLPPGDPYGPWLQAPSTGADMTIAVGSGLGQGIHTYLKGAPPGAKLAVLEPEPLLLAACLGLSDMRRYLESGVLFILPPDEEYIDRFISRLDLHYAYGRISLRLDPTARALGKNHLRWHELLQERLQSFSVDMQTMRSRQADMMDNELAHLERVRQSGVGHLKKQAAGLPAVVCGAGPSLERMAPHLGPDRGRRLIACGFQTLPALQRLSLTPHLCFAIDFRDTLLRVFDRLDMEAAREITLVYSTKTPPELPARWPGSALPVWTLGGLGPAAAPPGDPVLDVRGNVSVGLLRFLRWCGVTRALLIGQDFGVPAGGDDPSPTHSKGHHAEDHRATSSSAYTVEVDLGRRGRALTSPQLLAAHRDLNGWLRHSDMRVFTLYGGGLPIPEAREIEPDEAEDWPSLLSGGAAEPERLQRFLHLLRATGASPPHRELPLLPETLHADLDAARTELADEATASDRRREILAALRATLRAHPVLWPYLYNECLDLAGLGLPGRYDGEAALALVDRIGEKVTALEGRL